MSGLDQLQYLSWLLYLLVFVVVFVRTLRRPTPAHVDMTLLFGAIAVVIALTTITARLHLAQPEWLFNDLIAVLAVALGYLLLRLVHDFSAVPTWLMRAVEVGLVLSVVAFVWGPAPMAPDVSLLVVAYVALVIAYDTWAFARHARLARGVTRRRMQAAAAGSLSLTLVFVVAGLQVAFASWTGVWEELSAALGLASGGFYFVAFAPPTWLRRAWQEPEIRSFLANVASLTGLSDLRTIVRELERSAADAVGASGASIGLWDPDTRRLRGYGENGEWEVDPATRPVAGQAFVEQRVVLITDPARTDPANTAAFELSKARIVLAAPITAYGKQLGVLMVYASRAPVFANSDLELVQLLADQAAVILQSRELISEAAQVAAREEATRLKEDFLSSAAHDLKTPLAGLVTQAQLLQRKAERDPKAPADRIGLDRMVEGSLRLRDLVIGLLDVSRIEQGGIIGERSVQDLGSVVGEGIQHEPRWKKRVEAKIEPNVCVLLDEVRFKQVLSNLVENALKYSPPEAQVEVRVWRDNGEALLSVCDRGIGIPIHDQPLVFERFHRASNVDDRRFAGMGLGLYIARGIVEQHDGRIWVSSAPGEGSTFIVAFPVANGTPSRSAAQTVEVSS